MRCVFGEGKTLGGDFLEARHLVGLRAFGALDDIELAVQTEIPLIKQHLGDQVWAMRGGGVHGVRINRLSGESIPLIVRPSAATELRHGFATICRFFPGGRDLLAALEAGSPRLGLKLAVTAPQRAELLADARGDDIDAVLCLLQAAWGLQRAASPGPGHGLPEDIDPLEGWIVSA